MNKLQCFDGYLEKANGNGSTQIRELGNRLHSDVETAAKEWEQSVDSFYPKDSELPALPDGAWLLRVSFILSQPYTSKAEGDIHHHEERYDGKTKKWFEVHNPIVRDRLTGLPLVISSTWKGHLRFAARLRDLNTVTESRLFGSSRSEENAQRGRLHCFPTFFTGPVKREVVTPLNRHSRTPTRGPISIEVIPARDQGKGLFWLLYAPYPKGPKWTQEQIPDDLEAVGKAVPTMFLNYGFSAKKSAGWGVVEDKQAECCLWGKGPMWPASEKVGKEKQDDLLETPEDTFLLLMDETGEPICILKKENGGWMSNKEFNELPEKPCSQNTYKQFRRWYETNGELWRRKFICTGHDSRNAVQMYTTETVTGFCELTSRIAEAMRKENVDE